MGWGSGAANQHGEGSSRVGMMMMMMVLVVLMVLMVVYLSTRTPPHPPAPDLQHERAGARQRGHGHRLPLRRQSQRGDSGCQRRRHP